MNESSKGARTRLSLHLARVVEAGSGRQRRVDCGAFALGEVLYQRATDVLLLCRSPRRYGFSILQVV